LPYSVYQESAAHLHNMQRTFSMSWWHDVEYSFRSIMYKMEDYAANLYCNALLV